MKALAILVLFAFATISLSYRFRDRTANSAQTFLGTREDCTSSLDIHIVPHSHDDLGWLRTVQQYYDGESSNGRSESVKRILTSVVPALKADPNKKFIYVEVGFFKMWWDQQNDETKATVKELVKNGQFEFINGGYAMNDEADVYYEDCIEQMALGHKFLLENFGVTPEVGWQIDPFGHANAQAAMFAQMGFKALFMARIDYQDKEKRMNEKGMEMLWIPETSQGNENAILAHVNFHHYSNPTNFCFDVLCNDGTVTDDNVAIKANSFVEYFKDMSKSYKTNELMHTAGDDFHFMESERNYGSYDKLFKFIKDHSSEYKVNVFYSNPSQYLSAIYPLNASYPVKTDDFFPYADQTNAYWTGYFTSRPALKGLVREEGRFLQASRRLATQLLWEKSSDYLQKHFEPLDKALNELEAAVAIAQHHDAVAGTEKQAVVKDYEDRLLNGEASVKKELLFPALSELIQKNLGLSNVQLSTCQLNATATVCEVTYKNLQGDTPVLIAVYNSGPERSSVVQVKVPSAKIQAFHADGSSIPTDVICGNSNDNTDCELFFSDNFKRYDTAYYYLQKGTQSNEATAQEIKFGQDYDISPTQTISMEDLSHFNVKYCKDSGKEDCYSTKFNLAYNYYPSYQGDVFDGGQKSGAYIFRPAGDATLYSKPTSAKLYKGKNLIQIHIDGERVKTNMRIFGDLAKGIVLKSFVDSIPVDDGKGKEVILVVEVPSIKNQNTFYTDSMGMEMQKRVINFRPTWDLKVTEKVAGNYYPIQSTILIQDEDSKESFSILPDRSQGGSSLKEGQIELMLHRRILQDDGRGVAEALNEVDPSGFGLKQLVTHVLLFNKPGYIDTTHRQIQANIDTPNLVFLGAIPKLPESDKKISLASTSKLSQVDNDIKVMTRPLGLNKFLFRFQNMKETDSKTVNTNVFKSTNLGNENIVEMSLTANQAKTDMVSKKFNWNGLELNKADIANQDYLTSEEFVLRPLEIRTFVVTFGEPQTATVASL